MLAGVGGRTIAEAKENLTVDEFLAWREYQRRRGTLNVGLRVEAMVAQLLFLATIVHKLKRADGGAFALRDFYIHARADELDDSVAEDGGLTLAQAVKALRVTKIRTNTDG